MKNEIPILQSTTAKLIMIGLLTIVLLVPLTFVQDLIAERSLRKQEVISEITAKWGDSVLLYGPIIKIPYTAHYPVKNATETIPETEYAYFFPEQLEGHIDVNTTEKKRNNYEAVVFSSAMKFNGTFTKPNFSSKGIAPEDIQWDKATLLIKANNLKSIKDGMKIKLGEKIMAFETATNDPVTSVSTLETPSFSISEGFIDEKLAFNFDVSYDGSQELKIVPIGKTTSVSMKSNWKTPKFTGYFLPGGSEKKSDNAGFEASWKVLDFNRPFAQHYFGDFPELKDYSFGVDFIIPVDEYQKNERASKYGFLVIGLTFLVFFVIQSISKISIHIFNYTMIGLALVMFYTLLISITEHSSFLKAYLIAGISVVLMISLYSVSILKSKKFAVFIGLSLTALYTFIFVIIQLENYALLAGSIGLFVILGLVMYFSRKIDWNAIKEEN